MKIELDNGIIADTDKMTDKEAAISEAIHNLYKVCRQYDTTSFVRILVDQKKYMGLNTVTKDKERIQTDYDFLMETIAKYVDSTSGGQIQLMIESSPES